MFDVLPDFYLSKFSLIFMIDLLTAHNSRPTQWPALLHLSAINRMSISGPISGLCLLKLYRIGIGRCKFDPPAQVSGPLKYHEISSSHSSYPSSGTALNEFDLHHSSAIGLSIEQTNEHIPNPFHAANLQLILNVSATLLPQPHVEHHLQINRFILQQRDTSAELHTFVVNSGNTTVDVIYSQVLSRINCVS